MSRPLRVSIADEQAVFATDEIRGCVLEVFNVECPNLRYMYEDDGDESGIGYHPRGPGRGCEIGEPQERAGDWVDIRVCY